MYEYKPEKDIFQSNYTVECIDIFPFTWIIPLLIKLLKNVRMD